jgi:hypothetical protein
MAKKVAATALEAPGTFQGRYGSQACLGPKTPTYED